MFAARRSRENTRSAREELCPAGNQSCGQLLICGATLHSSGGVCICMCVWWCVYMCIMYVCLMCIVWWCICVYICLHVCVWCMYVVLEFRGQHCGVLPLLPPLCVFWGLDSGHYVCMTSAGLAESPLLPWPPSITNVYPVGMSSTLPWKALLLDRKPHLYKTHAGWHVWAKPPIWNAYLLRTDCCCEGTGVPQSHYAPWKPETTWVTFSEVRGTYVWDQKQLRGKTFIFPKHIEAFFLVIIPIRSGTTTIYMTLFQSCN